MIFMNRKTEKQESKERKTAWFSLLLALSFFLLLAFFPTQALLAKGKKSADDKKEEVQVKKEPINEADFQPVLVGALLEKPQDYIGKKIKFRGKFSSFTTLALDYKPAMRASKDYLSICIFRPDSKIPLSELKLAYPVKEAKENLVIRDLDEGDLLEIYAQVFSAALDEPWADILEIKEIESAQKKTEDDKDIKAADKSQDKKDTDTKETKKKKGKEKSSKESK